MVYSPLGIAHHRNLMRINKKHIPPIRLICKRHPLPLPLHLTLTHSLQRLSISFIQHIIVPPQHQDQETQSTKRSDDGDLARDVTRCFFGLEGLGAKDVAACEGDEG